jgi:hypothetical protein|tara:strand:+ start:66 stop:581 length:516 start_codon:yes stop_codon:yes gene_type:complete
MAGNRIAHRYVPVRFLCIILQLVFTVMLYLDRERSLYSGLSYSKVLTTSPRVGFTTDNPVVVAEYSALQITSANRWFNFITGGTIASLNIELFGMFTGYSLLSPLVCCGSIFLHVLGCVLTFMALTDGWFYPYLAFTMVVFAVLPAAIEVFVIIRECLCNLKMLRYIDLRV